MIPYILTALGGYLIGSSVKQYAKGGQVQLLAPNGKPSNLTPDQYRLVRTPEFKAWFGDWENNPENASKVVDDNGEPMMVYHGTKARGKEGIFSIFDLGKSGESSKNSMVGFWFTPIYKFAYAFAEGTWWGSGNTPFVYKVFLSIKNPKIYVSDESQYGDSYEKFRTDIYKIEGMSAEKANIGGIGMALKNEKETIEKYRKNLADEGFDGIFIKNTRFDRKEAGGYNDQYVAFYSTQIKSALINTTFDGSNPDIRYEYGGEMLKNKKTIEIMKGLGNKDKIKNWIERFHSKPVNYKPNTYYRIERKNKDGYAGVGKGLYLGRDKEALSNFYDIEQDGYIVKYIGNPKWLDLSDYKKYENFVSWLSKQGIEITNSDKVGNIVIEMGYDGIKYYDPLATGEEFVLFNTKKIKKIK